MVLRNPETPPGNMGLHFPYQANQMYYYRRPYNDIHVPTHVAESQDSPSQSTFGRGFGYSNQVFERAHETAEQYHNALQRRGGGIEKDGLLEFVDWAEHRQSRLNWEAIPRYNSGHQDYSFPSLNEEVMNRKSTGPQDFELGQSEESFRR